MRQKPYPAENLTAKLAAAVVAVGVISRSADAQTATPARTAAMPAGRDSNAPADTPKSYNNNVATETGALMAKSGGSLMRASLAVQADPNQARGSDASFFAVPEPTPKTIKKHDLVTIIVHEESAFTSKGTSELKRTADLEAKINAFIRFKLDNLTLSGGGVAANPPAISATSAGTSPVKGRWTAPIR